MTQNKKITTMKKEELSKKIDAINLDALTNKSIVNRQIWKKEILANFKTEKTARRILRSKQLELSKAVVKFAKLKNDADLKIAIIELEKFYKTNLVSRDKFTNISDEKTEGQIILYASELCKQAK
jgi:hypothetical protein